MYRMLPHGPHLAPTSTTMKFGEITFPREPAKLICVGRGHLSFKGTSKESKMLGEGAERDERRTKERKDLYCPPKRFNNLGRRSLV